MLKVVAVVAMISSLECRKYLTSHRKKGGHPKRRMERVDIQNKKKQRQADYQWFLISVLFSPFCKQELCKAVIAQEFIIMSWDLKH